MVFRTNPSLGPELDQVITAADGAWYEPTIHTYASTQPTLVSPQEGDLSHGSDGRHYMWVRATGTIADAAAPGTQVTLTIGDGTATAATGAGGWYAPPAATYGTDILAGDYFWAAKGTAP